LTDSHIGKKTGGYGNSKWDIFPVEQLNDAVRLLSTVDLDTVVYTGDLFHEDSSGVDEQNIESVKEIFGSHLPGVLPIRYIKGNHAKEQGKRIWSQLENEGIAEPLTGYPHEINETAIYGVDHYYDDSEWSDTVSDLRSTDSDYKILCLHQSVEEIEERLSGLSAEELPDLILLGHPHAVIDRKIEVDDKLIQVLCYGSTTRLGNKREEYPPGAALIISGPMFSQIGYLSTEIS
jgi:predicted phosphodiesterase